MCREVLQKAEVEIPPSDRTHVCAHLAAFIDFYANSPVILASPGAFPVVAQCATCNGPLEVIDSGAVKP